MCFYKCMYSVCTVYVHTFVQNVCTESSEEKAKSLSNNAKKIK